MPKCVLLFNEVKEEEEEVFGTGLAVGCGVFEKLSRRDRTLNTAFSSNRTPTGGMFN
jgi:hypothetical protein